MDGRQVLLFWYRNQIYAIEGRAPSEGAYSEGFIKAKFTQVALMGGTARQLQVLFVATCARMSSVAGGVRGPAHGHRMQQCVPT